MPWPEIYRDKKRAYLRLLLDGSGNVKPDAELVLADLKKFCFVDRSTLVVSPVTRIVDTHATMVAEGRREVWNRIQAYLRLDDGQIMDLREDNRNVSSSSAIE
jgi:hypothetical protein